MAPRAKRKPEMLCITLRRSPIGCSPHQRAVIRGLGLKRVRQRVLRADTPEIRGMIRKIPHLVSVEPGTGEEATHET